MFQDDFCEWRSTRLCFHDKVLDDYKSLRDYDIQQGDKVVLKPDRSAVVGFKLQIQTLTGKKFSIIGRPSDSIKTVKKKIEFEAGIAPDEQMLIHKGKYLADRYCLGDCDIMRETSLSLVRTVRGMISTFTTETTHQPGPLVEYLLLGDPSVEPSSEMLDLLELQGEFQKADPDLDFEFSEFNGVLNHQYLDVFSKFLDFSWVYLAHKFADSPENNPEVVRDIRLAFERASSLQRLLDLVDAKQSANVAEQLLRLHHSSFGTKVALRITHGPTNGCINWMYWIPCRWWICLGNCTNSSQ